MSKLRVGILGCAKIAEKYATRAFQAIDNAEVVSIASRDSRKAKEWASRFGIKNGESYEDLISSPEVDAVYIPLPVGLHKEWVLKAATKKKHIISEKSLAGDFASVKEIADAARKNNVVLYENFMCDFHPQHEAVLSLIKDGKVGKPFIFQGFFGIPPLADDNIRYDKNLGGGSLNDAGVYTVFMARKILGMEPLTATCTLYNDGGHQVDVKGTAKLEFPDGMEALLAFSFDALYQSNYSVWGEKGLIKVARAYSIPPDVKPTIELTTNENSKEAVTQIDAPAANHFELSFSDFCDTVLNKNQRTDKINKTYAGLVSHAKVIEAMRISARENRKVSLTELF